MTACLREKSKRGAAAVANATQGRARTFKNKKKYDRKSLAKAGD